MYVWGEKVSLGLDGGAIARMHGNVISGPCATPGGRGFSSSELAGWEEKVKYGGKSSSIIYCKY